jgi:hypothetical protein
VKRIPLTQDKVAIVDDADYGWLSQWKWRAHKMGKFCYAVRSTYIEQKRGSVSMHRQVLGLLPGDGFEADHINHDTLDNQRSNLRRATKSQNHQNQYGQITARSQFKGLYWHPGIKKWRARIKHNYKYIQIGYFKEEIEAAKAYDNAAKELHGEFACLNFPDMSEVQYACV